MYKFEGDIRVLGRFRRVLVVFVGGLGLEISRGKVFLWFLFFRRGFVLVYIKELRY